jgi:hypothetical protein
MWGLHLFDDENSWSRSWYDGGRHCGYPFRDYQVRSRISLFCQFIILAPYFRTKLIDDAKRPNPQYRGLAHGTMSIIRQEGILGIYRGLFPVVSVFDAYNICISQ